MERELEKQRLNNMLRDTSPNSIKKKYNGLSSVGMSSQYTKNGNIDPRISTPTISSSHWRLKNQGDMNYEMRNLPVKPKNADILTNAYTRDFRRQQDSLNYYKDLRDQYMRDKQNKDQKNQQGRDMDHLHVQNEVKKNSYRKNFKNFLDEKLQQLEGQREPRSLKKERRVR